MATEQGHNRTSGATYIVIFDRGTERETRVGPFTTIELTSSMIWANSYELGWIAIAKKPTLSPDNPITFGDWFLRDGEGQPHQTVTIEEA